MKFKESFVIFVAICCIHVEAQRAREYCGRKFSATGLSFGGRRTHRNEWPWLVALIYLPKNAFLCGGSLVSKKHVISGEICKLSDEVKIKFIEISQLPTASSPNCHLESYLKMTSQLSLENTT
jgi:Trypsin